MGSYLRLMSLLTGPYIHGGSAATQFLEFFRHLFVFFFSFFGPVCLLDRLMYVFAIPTTLLHLSLSCISFLASTMTMLPISLILYRSWWDHTCSWYFSLRGRTFLVELQPTNFLNSSYTFSFITLFLFFFFTPIFISFRGCYMFLLSPLLFSSFLYLA